MIAPGKQTDWFYKFIAGYTILHLVWMVVLLYDFFSHPLAPDPMLGSPAYRLFSVLVLTPLGLTVSVMVLRRTPGNVTGLFLLLWCVLGLGDVVPHDSPIYIYNRAFNTGWTGLWLLALYFPTGRPAPVRFERWIRLLSAATILLVAAWAFFQPTLNDFNAANLDAILVANPVFIPALRPFQALANGLELACLISVIVLILPSMWLRYRSSSQTERSQIKWLVWTYGLVIASFAFFIPTGLLSGNQYKYGVPGLVAVTIFGLFVEVAPYISIGNAILRHRLYDIDIIIRRTLVYGSLSLVLGACYAGSVLLLQRLFTLLTGQTSPVAVVISTLGIVALFNPLRGRIQLVIDRRFFRRKYDAQQVLAVFANTARSETELDAVTAELQRVVWETMQPEQVGIWLRVSANQKLD